MEPDQDKGTTMRKVAKTALFLGSVVLALTAVFFAAPLVISAIAAHGIAGVASLAFLKTIGVSLLAHLPTLAIAGGAGMAAGGLWRATEEAANHHLDQAMQEAKAIERERAAGQTPSRERSQDYSKLYEAAGIEPKGDMAAQIEQRRMAKAAAAGQLR